MAHSRFLPIVELRQRIAAPMSPATMDTGLISLRCDNGHAFHVVAMIGSMYEDKRGFVDFTHEMLGQTQGCVFCQGRSVPVEVWLACWLPVEGLDVIAHRVAGGRPDLTAWSPSGALADLDLDHPALDEMPPALATRRAVLADDEEEDGGLALIDDVLGRWVDYVPAMKARARVLKALERHADAQAVVERCLELEPGDAETYFFLGDILDEIHEIDLALHAYNCSLAIDPRNPDAHNQRAILLRRNGRVDEAIEGYRAALGVSPHHPSTLNNLAIIHHERDDHAAVLELLERVRPSDLENEPVVPGLFSLASECGVRRARVEDMPTACRFFELACGFREDVASAWYNWAMALIESGCLGEAVVKLKHALALAPRLEDAAEMLEQCQELAALPSPRDPVMAREVRRTLHYVDARGRERRLLSFVVSRETCGGLVLAENRPLSLSSDRDLLALLAIKGHNRRVDEGKEGRRIKIVVTAPPDDDLLALAGALEFCAVGGIVVPSGVAPVSLKREGRRERPLPLRGGRFDLPRVPRFEDETYGDVFYPLL